MAAGLGQADAILRQIHARCPEVEGTTRLEEFAMGKAQLLIWEAYVTSRQGPTVPLPARLAARVSSHARDAFAASLLFTERAKKFLARDLQAEPSISMAGLHLLNNGLSENRSLLAEPCIVLKARKPQ